MEMNKSEIIGYKIVQLVLVFALIMFVFLLLVGGQSLNQVIYDNPKLTSFHFFFFLAGITIVMILLLNWWYRRTLRKEQEKKQEPSDTLKKSFAEGKISIEEYEKRKKYLEHL